MLKVEYVDVWGWSHAIRGMRNPMNSWDKSDTVYGEHHGKDNMGKDIYEYYKIPEVGKNDLALMNKLYHGGAEHRKFMRQLQVSLDITAPLYWWKEFDTYKVGTVSNSCSTMHKLASKEFTIDDFSHDHLIDRETDNFECSITGEDGVVYDINATEVLEVVIRVLNEYRRLYLVTRDIKYWWQMIQLLPSSYNQKRTITMNYENAVNIIHQREYHKLDEWINLVSELRQLPYIKEIMADEQNGRADEEHK